MIIIMGAIGSGKSEQAIRLAKDLNIPRVSTSQLLKNNLTPEREAKMLAGELVNDKEVTDLLEAEYARIGADKNEFVSDGSPRSVAQAKWMLDKMLAGKLKITAVIMLNVSNETVITRLLKRGRSDDKKEIIMKRLNAYEQVTQPVVGFFRDNGVGVDEVNGELGLDEVQAEIKRVLKSKL